jgi:uncharacterized protein YqeY
MSALLAQLQSDLVAARKAQDKSATLLLGTILADVKNRRIELRHDLADAEIGEVLRKGIQRRRESVELYGRGGRADLVAREQAEVDALGRYLPPEVDAAELRAAVQAAIAGGAATMGAVMGRVAPQFKGRADGSAISAIAREELAARA